MSGSYLTWNGSEWESKELVISICPEGYVLLGGSCYKNYDLAYTYANARNTCLADGADLVVINDSSENTLVGNYRNTSNFWIGYNDLSVEGTFEWVDGSATGYSNWKSGEPNNYNGLEDCTVVSASGYVWNDAQCSNNYYFICEKNSSQSNVGVTRLVSLTDVSASSPSSGEALVWTGSAWEPSATASAIDALGDIGDVSSTVATEGQVLAWDDTNKSWEPSETSVGVSALASLTDVSATDAATGSILRYDGTSWTAVADLSTALSTTTMVSGWPDAIRCNVTNPSWGDVMFYMHYPEGISSYHPGKTVYRMIQSSNYYDIIFNADMSFSGYSNLIATDCNQLIATLYSEGRAFNFLGNNGAQTSMTEIADVSASAPTDGQLLRYNASENEWVATDVISKTIIYNSIDDNPCVVTGGVRKLSFNPTTGRLRVCRP